MWPNLRCGGKLTSQEETIYEIAYNLGIPVYKLMAEMPYDELKKWVTFFRERPPGWREDYRTYIGLKMWGYKGKPGDVFPSLAIIESVKNSKEQAGMVLPKGKFLEKMLKAVGGDTSGWKPEWGG